MGRLFTAQRARSIALEVASYRRDYDGRRERIAKSLDFYLGKMAGARDVEGWQYVVGALAFAALDQSHVVIRRADRRILSRGRTSVLTRRTLAMTAFAGTPFQPKFDKELDDCCLGVELKFVHGLEHHRLRKPSGPSHEAALILHDVEGGPLAYQKAVGYNYAYVWRNGLMQTRAGLRYLPAGSIVKPLYGDDKSPPHEKYAGAGLVGITGCTAEDIKFKRFGLDAMPEAIRTAGLLDASAPGAYENYRRHVGEASAMNTDMFAGCIAELMKNTRVYPAA